MRTESKLYKGWFKVTRGATVEDLRVAGRIIARDLRKCGVKVTGTRTVREHGGNLMLIDVEATAEAIEKFDKIGTTLTVRFLKAPESFRRRRVIKLREGREAAWKIVRPPRRRLVALRNA